MRIAVGIGLHFEHIGRAQIVFVVEEVVDAGGAVRLFPAVGQVRFVGWSNDASVCGDDQAAIGIEGLRELIEWDVAGPFVVVRVAGDGNFSVTFFANGHARGHHVADIALHVGVDGVLGRAPDFFHDAAKFFPVLRFAQPVVDVG